REGRGLRAHVSLRSAGGRAAGSRDLVSRSGDCGELASSLTLAISIAIDPLALAASEQPAAPPTAPLCPPQLACPEPPAPVCPERRRAGGPRRPPGPRPPPVAARTRIGFRLGAGGLLSIGAAPSAVAGGAWVRAGLRAAAFSLDLEGRADPAASALVPGA